MSWDGASAEGPCLESTSPSSSSTPPNERSGDSNSLLCGEAPPEKDEKKDTNISDMKLSVEDNSSKPAAVIEAMTTTVHEKTKLERSTDDSSYKEGIVQEPIETATIQELSVDGQSERGEVKNTSKDSGQKQSGTMKVVQQSSKSSSCKFLPSAHLKEKVKAVPSATTVPPHYLGTLKVLEDKHLQKNSTEFDRADSLRAAVFQNWMEKKRALLLELKRAEKKKAEELRNDTEKKEAVKREEANASFKSWKAMKAREAKKLNEKKKLEKLKEKEAAEQNAERAEAAQKAFEKWKEKKIEYLREKGRQEEQSERIRKKKEEELAAEKKRDSISAVEKWNDKKKEYMKQKKAEKIIERRKKEIQQAEKDEKDKMAREEYERWLGNTLRREQLQKKQKNLHAVHRNEVPFPWVPPGKVTYTKNY
ncbi:microtubule-associated protein 9 isoform X1 [Phasianus colchicus]|uniref:microtubule-associated protein 9 isoform X1 n=1 Tax=Phasianus colchicus TaxID=9054 RepID=UPI00129E0ED2|nr:microtubule-associated protein 9 isoform X1 [Phasianus colchicus]